MKARAGVFRSEKGFTLIEIMVVITILAILAVLVVPKIVNRTDEARQVAAKTQIRNIEQGLQLYKIDNGVYPTTEQGLAALVTKSNISPIPEGWKGPYLKKGIPKDPWGKAYLYRYPGERNKEDYDLYSYGADGVEGGGDDVVNWELHEG